jgi:hypothetical protein
LPYLSDLVRLEWCYVQAFHAADAEPAPLAELAGLLADENRLARVRFILHPSLQVLRSSYALVSLWGAHQGDDAEALLQSIDPLQPESALLLRQDQAVQVLRVEPGAAQFIEQLLQGASFAEAVGTDTPFNLAAALEILLRGGAIVRYQVQE